MPLSDLQVQLSSEMSSAVTGLVALLKGLEKVASPMRHMEYFSLAVEMLKLAVTFKLQAARMEVSSDGIKNDPKNAMLYQLCTLRGAFGDAASKLQAYAEQHLAAAAAVDDDVGFPLALCGDDLFQMLAPQLQPEELLDAVRVQCVQHKMSIRSMVVSLENAAGHLHTGDKSWKINLPEDRSVLAEADAVVRGTHLGIERVDLGMDFGYSYSSVVD